MKKCPQCSVEKELSEFGDCKANKDGKASWCKPCKNANQAAYREANREAINARKMDAYYENHEENKADRRSKREVNKDAINAYKRELNKNLTPEQREQRNSGQRERWANDPQFKLGLTIRNRTNEILRGSVRNSSYQELIGCDQMFLVRHIESQFRPTWNWSNWGSVWHLDHFYPLAAVDINNQVEILAASNWRNLRPLGSVANMRKKNKVYPEAQKLFDKLCREFSKKEDAA